MNEGSTSTKVIVIYAMYYVLRFLGVVWKYTWIKDFFYWVKKGNFLHGHTNYNFAVVLTISFCTGVKEIYFINPKF